MAEAGWFPDPTGRFGQRWYDGSTWTKNAVGANGGVIDDDLPQTDTPFPPPVPTYAVAPQSAAQSAPSAAPPAGPQGGYGPPAGPYGGTPAGLPTVRYGVGAGLVIGLVGLLLVVLSLFAVGWGKGSKTRFTDFSSAARKANPTSFPDVGEHLYYVYVSWLGFVLLAAVVVLTVLAGIPVPRTGAGNRFWRIGASLLAGVAGVLHTMTITYIFTGTGQTAGAGALLGLFGYLVVMIAMIFGARRIVRPPGRAY